jgi:hypothetical protein
MKNMCGKRLGADDAVGDAPNVAVHRALALRLLQGEHTRDKLPRIAAIASAGKRGSILTLSDEGPPA